MNRKYNNSNLPKINRLCLTIGILFSSMSTANAALSAVTAKTIQGTAPFFLLSDGVTKLTNLDELMGFSMPNRDGTPGIEQIDATQAGTPIIIPANMKYNQISTIVTADNLQNSLNGSLVIDDNDGDSSPITNTFATGDAIVTWTNNLGVVPISDHGSILDPCLAPYTLTIKIPTNVTANTIFGNPNIRNYGLDATGVIYTFIPAASQQQVCFVKPLDTTVFNIASASKSKYPGLGYNANSWLPGQGFKVPTNFPKTGFEKAAFSVIGSGASQINYKCEISPSVTWAQTVPSLATATIGQNCTIKYNGNGGVKPTTGFTVVMKTISTNVQIGQFQVDAPQKWAVIKGASSVFNTINNLSGTYNQAKLCGAPTLTGLVNKTLAESYMWHDTEISNSPQFALDTLTNHWSGSGSRFSRDDDGTLLGEWGNLNTYGVSSTAPITTWFSGNTNRNSVGAYFIGMIRWTNGDNGSRLVNGTNDLVTLCKL